MPDVPHSTLQSGYGEDSVHSGAMKTHRSNEAQGIGDELSANISERLEEIHLGGATAMDRSMPATALPESREEPRPAPTDQSSSRVESTISNSQITTGRDVISYNFTGNLTINNKYEESSGTTPEISKNISERANHVDEEDDIASGMLIPAPPACILERDAQHSQIVAKLLSISNARVAILGMGGIGKTTLACSVANDPEIEDIYSRRLFLSFEGCSTPDLAYTNLASAFHVPVDRRSSHRQILSQILTYLKQEKTLFVIDNFETLWEIPSNRRAAEELLAQLAALPKLAMVVTLRGIQRPGNIRWVKIEPLQTLTEDGSRELLSVITDEEYVGHAGFEYVRRLLNAVAGIPLAVTLIGALLRDDWETPQSLWHRWTRESTKAICIANDTEPDDRLYKLDVSLRLSIFGPRMSDHTKEVLAGIAILPTGLSMDENWLDKFQGILQSTINIRSCISALRNVALCILESASTPPRLRLLPPVRDFCLQNMPPDGVFVHRMIEIYISDIQRHWDQASGENYSWVTTELSNLPAILDRAITLRHLTDDLGDATYRYTEWRRFLCIPETDTVQHVIDVLSDHPTAKALCLQAIGYTLSESSNRTQEAIQQFEHALSIHRSVDDKFEIQWDLYLLGKAYSRLHDDANAEHHLNEARDLFTETNSGWNMGLVLQALADVYLSQKKLPQAERTAKEALELCRVSGTREGEINTLWTLGRVYREQVEYDLAVETLTAARDASRAIHYTFMEACTNESLGDVYQDAKKPDQAFLHYQLAVPLFERAQYLDRAEDVRATLKKLETPSGIPNDR